MGELDRGLAEKINAEHRACEQAAATAVEHAMNAGDYLEEAKASLPHGEFLPWLEANFEGSRRTAQTYMRLATNREELDAQHAAHLSIRGALAELSAPASEEANLGPASCPIPTFEDGVKSMLALAEIRDSGAWRESGYEDFESYLAGRWNTDTGALDAWEAAANDPPRVLRGKPMALMAKVVKRLKELEASPLRSQDGKYPPEEAIGRGLAEIETDELYKLLGYTTFNRYCSERLGLSRKWREALLLYAELDEVMPFEKTSTGLPYIPEDLPYGDFVKGWKILTEIAELVGAEEE